MSGSTHRGVRVQRCRDPLSRPDISRNTPLPYMM